MPIWEIRVNDLPRLVIGYTRCAVYLGVERLDWVSARIQDNIAANNLLDDQPI